MGYSNTKVQKQTAETENTFSGVNAQRKMAAVPVLQKVDDEKVLPVQGKFVAQLQAPEEELEG